MTAWFRYESTTPRHPKVRRVARALGVPRVQIVGHLACLWAETCDLAPDGDLSSYGTEDVELMADWEGETGALVAELVKVRLLDQDDEGHLHVHEWMERQEKSKAAIAKRKQRATKKQALITATSRTVSSCVPAKKDSVQNVHEDETRRDETDVTISASSSKTLAPKPAASRPADDSPVVFEYPTKGKTKRWQLRESQLARWRELYSVDVLAECRSALAWCEANPTKQKTSRGMPAFLTSWLNRAQNRGQSAGPAPPRRETVHDRARARTQAALQQVAREVQGDDADQRRDNEGSGRGAHRRSPLSLLAPLGGGTGGNVG